MAAEAEISSCGVRSSYQSVATKVKQEGKKIEVITWGIRRIYLIITVNYILSSRLKGDEYIWN